jgi:tetratricopeptide (TPR) repeat protein
MSGIQRTGDGQQATNAGLVQARDGVSHSELALLLQRAQEALRDNRLHDARIYSEQIQALAPDNPNGSLIAGMVEFKSRSYASAIGHFRKVVGLDGRSTTSHFWLGNALRHHAQFAEAVAAYREALRMGPSADAAFNLELTLRDEAKVKLGASLIRHGSQQRNDPATLQQAVDLAGELARSGIEPPPADIVSAAHVSPFLSFVTCSVTPSKLARLRASLETALTGKRWELIAITDARSLSEGYARGMTLGNGDLLVFCHDDIEILCDQFYDRLVGACTDADVVGVAGVTLLNGPALSWAGTPHMHGAVTYPRADGGYSPSICSAEGPRIDRAQALDGLFIAVWRQVAASLGFDATTFDGFDFYDVDFSYRAWKNGFRLRIQTDLRLLHASRGKFGEKYAYYSERFRQKHEEFAGCPPISRAYIHETHTSSLADAGYVHRWLGDWLT